MTRIPRNNSRALEFYRHPKSTKFDKVVIAIGSTGLFVVFVLEVIQDALPQHVMESLVPVYGIGFLVGILALIIEGVRVYRWDNQIPNIAGTIARVLAKTFLYLFLPAIVITALLFLAVSLEVAPRFMNF